jgi:hypothetical protein
LQRHAEQMAAGPQCGMPWNYQDALAWALMNWAKPYESIPI